MRWPAKSDLGSMVFSEGMFSTPKGVGSGLARRLALVLLLALSRFGRSGAIANPLTRTGAPRLPNFNHEPEEIQRSVPIEPVQKVR